MTEHGQTAQRKAAAWRGLHQPQSKIAYGECVGKASQPIRRGCVTADTKVVSEGGKI